MGWLGLSNLKISGNYSTHKSSLQDQDEQQICFFENHFPVKNYVGLVATDARNILDVQFLKVCGICQTVTTALQDRRAICDSFMYILVGRLNIIHGSSVCFLTIMKLIKLLENQSFLFCLIF